ncbi:MAG: amidohydrolase family protein [Acidimicrobiia bacterium]|nr:amidohydrolase family protein [Acidimicrobiia bacterium]
MSSLAVRGGTVIDETGARRADVLVVDGLVAEVAPAVSAEGARELDATGCWVCPGLVDLHVHLRQPGAEHAETVATGSRAAALGGFTAVVAMANTLPPLDTVAAVRQVRAWGREAGLCDVHPAAAITVGRAGERLVDFAALHAAGVRLFTDDGDEVADAAVMRAAFEATAPLDGAVLGQHSECATLVAGGHLHEGDVSDALGLRGRPAEAEEVTVARDLALARLTGGRLHVLHASAARTVDLVRRARAEGVAVTMEVTPQHLTLTQQACAGGDPTFKVNPPLRDAADLAALRAGLADGTVDAIATDHAPHPPAAKARPFADAPPGMLGLETALAVVLTDLVAPGVVDLPTALRALSWRPARIAGLRAAGHGRPVAPGEPANLCVVDPGEAWVVDGAALASRSRNTPFAGRRLEGRARHTVQGGEAVVVGGEAQR